MRKSTMAAPVLAVALLLPGCGKQAAPPVDSVGAETGAASSLKHGNGAGAVTAIDAGSDSVTLDHGPIADLNWPAMTMSFAAKSGQLAGLRVGDKVEFEIDWDGKTALVTSIRKAR